VGAPRSVSLSLATQSKSNKVSNVDLKNPSKFYYNHYKEDLVYSGLNVIMVKRYLADEHNEKRKWKSQKLARRPKI